MYEIPSGLPEYLDFIRQGVDLFDSLTAPDSDEFYELALSLTQHRFSRKRRIKRMFSVLLESQYLTHYQLKFKLYVKTKAFMTDSGIVCFSLAHVCRTSGAMLIKLIMHEVAHLWLSRQSGYAQLKALQREFHASYGISDATEALSPIEHYAIALSVVMLKRLLPLATGKAHNSIVNQIEREESKLTDLKAIID